MKKLLIIGGVIHAIEIVEQAHKMGIQVYVTDYLEDSPAKKLLISLLWSMLLMWMGLLVFPSLQLAAVNSLRIS